MYIMHMQYKYTVTVYIHICTYGKHLKGKISVILLNHEGFTVNSSLYVTGPEKTGLFYRQKISGAQNEFLRKTRFNHARLDIPFLRCLAKFQLHTVLVARDTKRSFQGCRSTAHTMNEDGQITRFVAAALNFSRERNKQWLLVTE